nr:MAG TPA: hypothetical protein [Caudoviricetes sp.]
MSRTAGLCKILISKGRYEYDDMYTKLDLFLMMGRISDEEYVELTGMMQKPEEPKEPAKPEETGGTQTETASTPDGTEEASETAE